MNELKKYRIIFWICILTSTCISPFVVMISSKDKDIIYLELSIVLLIIMAISFIVSSVFLFKMLKLEKELKEKEE